MITLILIVAVAVGVFLFVKNNPKKTNKIDEVVKNVADQIKEVMKK